MDSGKHALHAALRISCAEGNQPLIQPIGTSSGLLYEVPSIICLPLQFIGLSDPALATEIMHRTDLLDKNAKALQKIDLVSNCLLEGKLVRFVAPFT